MYSGKRGYTASTGRNRGIAVASVLSPGPSRIRVLFEKKVAPNTGVFVSIFMKGF